ncbi:succinyl-diaminopimelate desuccinylase [Peteryoungia desertarenae]|uniref:Succinyl-diaminopimelate desuccinylase n=1 Tax=Peteryoungia desertarenae TaxID=1813451 RepID=A0ABX6QL19_9HYPH|nr:succinyl-diaminopimelate desuccinylase [Peteryoungia desertarenae]QLF69230.1 succinyl-diaminopimelate desuccinylase [Peteryoungia desertarenae]
MIATNPIDVLQALIRCPSVTPAEGGALDVLTELLEPLGFDVQRMTAKAEGTPDIENLYARTGKSGPHLMFAGHSDVVPVGAASDWTVEPFSGEVRDGMLYGRGAVDMKGGIACFIAAYARLVAKSGAPDGSVSLLITGDEEGPAINGTIKLLQWAAERGERWDACLVGEPTNPDELGDMIKIGRRGSISGFVTVHGVQGHVAYPHLADNPLRAVSAMTQALMYPPLDQGTENFPPTNLEVTNIDTGNTATNVVPAKGRFDFNVRFNDLWTADTIRDELLRRLDIAARNQELRPGRDPIRYDITWSERPSHVFLTRDDALIQSLSKAVETVTGRIPKLSTTGGTSDARFIKDYCPVVEFGLVGQTMHMVDERVAVSDLETLTVIYETFLEQWFEHANA